MMQFAVGFALGGMLYISLGIEVGSAVVGSDVGAVIGFVVGSDVGAVVIVGSDDGGGVGQAVPNELPVVNSQPEVTWLERAWTSVGTSEQNWLSLRYCREERGGV